MREGQGHIPRIPPKRKTPNLSPSSGDRSFLAAGSSRQTWFFTSPALLASPSGGGGYMSSTLRFSGVKASSVPSFSGTRNSSGREDRKNRLPDFCESWPMQMYSSSDQGPSSGSRCSTMYVLPLPLDAIVVGGCGCTRVEAGLRFLGMIRGELVGKIRNIPK